MAESNTGNTPLVERNVSPALPPVQDMNGSEEENMDAPGAPYSAGSLPNRHRCSEEHAPASDFHAVHSLEAERRAQLSVQLLEKCLQKVTEEESQENIKAELAVKWLEQFLPIVITATTFGASIVFTVIVTDNDTSTASTGTSTDASTGKSSGNSSSENFVTKEEAKMFSALAWLFFVVALGMASIAFVAVSVHRPMLVDGFKERNTRKAAKKKDKERLSRERENRKPERKKKTEQLFIEQETKAKKKDENEQLLIERGKGKAKKEDKKEHLEPKKGEAEVHNAATNMIDGTKTDGNTQGNKTEDHKARDNDAWVNAAGNNDTAVTAAAVTTARVEGTEDKIKRVKDAVGDTPKSWKNAWVWCVEKKRTVTREVRAIKACVRKGLLKALLWIFLEFPFSQTVQVFVLGAFVFLSLVVAAYNRHVGFASLAFTGVITAVITIVWLCQVLWIFCQFIWWLLCNVGGGVWFVGRKYLPGFLKFGEARGSKVSLDLENAPVAVVQAPADGEGQEAVAS